MTVVWFAIGYLIGSVPVAWLITKWVTGQDIRKMGSGNVGVMNTAVSTARWAGLLVFLAEITKGVLAVVIPRAFGGSEIDVVLTALAAVIGTRWSIWLDGAGGRGNTTGMGAMFLISWKAVIVLPVLWVLTRLLTRNSFLATRANLVVLPLSVFVFTQSWLYTLFGAVLSLIYLRTQNKETDDHLIIKDHWSSLWTFITSPPRK